MFPILICLLPILLFAMDTTYFYMKTTRSRLIENTKEYFICRTIPLGVLSSAIIIICLVKNPIVLILIFPCTLIYFYVSHNTYSVLNLALFLEKVICKRRSCRIYMGFFFAVTKIRDYILFCFARNRIHMIVVAAENLRKGGSSLLSFLKLYLRGKIVDIVDIDSISIILIQGKTQIFDPEKQGWYTIRGKISCIVFPHI